MKSKDNQPESEARETEAAAKQDQSLPEEADKVVETPGAEGEAPAADTAEPAEEPSEAESPDISELMEKLDQVTAEANTMKERYLRTVADLENFRKRAIRDKEEARRGANVTLVEELLPVLDNFKLGLDSAARHDGGEAFAEGFKMILVQMETVLKQNGVEPIDPTGAPFDPNFHEAVGHADSETVDEGSVAEVHRIGYSLNGRLIRPATVVVSNGPGKAEEPGD